MFVVWETAGRWCWWCRAWQCICFTLQLKKRCIYCKRFLGTCVRIKYTTEFITTSSNYSSHRCSISSLTHTHTNTHTQKTLKVQRRKKVSPGGVKWFSSFSSSSACYCHHTQNLYQTTHLVTSDMKKRDEYTSESLYFSSKKTDFIIFESHLEQWRLFKVQSSPCTWSPSKECSFSL